MRPSRPVVPYGDRSGRLTDDQRRAAMEGMARHVDDVEALAARADAYFDETYPATVIEFLQAVMREAWKDEAGSYSKWDRLAEIGGVLTIGKVILG